MFFAHLPAGYLLTKRIQNSFNTKKYLILGLIASVLPDLDIFYFLFFDHQQTFHHKYWTHIPFYWAVIGVVVFLSIIISKKQKYLAPAVIFFINIFTHLVLDTVVGGIDWLSPFSEKSYYFVKVAAVYDFWVYNFVLHWTFLLELTIISGALIVFIKNRYAQKYPNYGIAEKRQIEFAQETIARDLE